MRFSKCCLLKFAGHHLTSKNLPASAINQAGPLNRLFNRVVTYYEECLGVTEVQRARNEVMQCEENLYRAQQARREKQAEIKIIQNKLKDIHSELDRTPRGEDKYLHLITEEHAAIKRERDMMSLYEDLENRERDAFNILSNKVRVSHEREREREERTKYWSLTGSLLGALLGIIGTSIATEIRMRHIREMIPSGQEVSTLLNDMVQIVRSSQGQVSDFLNDLKGMLNLDSPKLVSLPIASEVKTDTESDLRNTIDGLKNQNSMLMDQMDELKRLIKLDRALADADEGHSIVYVGDSMETMLQQTEKNIESRMKLQTLAIVVGSYTLIAITVPLIYYFFFGKK